MPVISVPAFLRAFASVLALVSLALVVGCQRGDLGAPCNHGTAKSPPGLLITFPAPSCNDLYCAYAESEKPPDIMCSDDAACNAADEKQRSQCDEETGKCKLRLDYVLSRSMCSRKCNSNDDCKDSGVKKVLAKDHACKFGFICARVQKLGKYCCERLCVCQDDLSSQVLAEIDGECRAEVGLTCCAATPKPEGCGN